MFVIIQYCTFYVKMRNNRKQLQFTMFKTFYVDHYEF